MDTSEALQRGRRALKEGRWADARADFEAVLQVEEQVDAVQGLGDALWWLGDAAACLARMERAYALYREAGDAPSSAAMAVWLAASQLKCFGNRAACRGWIATAERLAEQTGLPELAGWVDWARAAEAADPEAGRQWAQRSLDAARQLADRDLELCALAELGKCLVALGRSAEGLPLIDEAMVAALGGEAPSLDTVVATCCSMMGACDQAADLERITQWCRAADQFMNTYGSPFLFADCRQRYGSVLLATGHWADAERELLAAAQVTPPETDYHQQATARLAKLRLRQGRLEEAQALLESIRDRPPALLPRAVLHQSREEFAVAEQLCRRLLDSGPEIVERAEALDLLVSCQLAQGKVEVAVDSARELEELAPHVGRAAAHHAHAQARIALATNQDPAEAERWLEQAMRLFSDCRLPYETARARLALARALVGHPEVAVAEAQGAFATFEQLGAVADADAAAHLIRTLGGAARTGPKDIGVLTKREREVLRLVAEGLSNPEIAARLYLSRKTVSHHVSNILSKLGLRNRAEAAVYAGRMLSDAGSAPAGS